MPATQGAPDPSTREGEIPTTERPIIVFDVNQTLLDLETLLPTVERNRNDPGGDGAVARHSEITYSEALTLAGVYVPFTDIGLFPGSNHDGELAPADYYD